MPPTFAGVTRLTNDEASWARMVGTNGSRCGTPPVMPMPAATYVTPDITTQPASQPQLAERIASMLSSTLASCGSRK